MQCQHRSKVYDFLAISSATTCNLYLSNSCIKKCSFNIKQYFICQKQYYLKWFQFQKSFHNQAYDKYDIFLHMLFYLSHSIPTTLDLHKRHARQKKIKERTQTLFLSYVSIFLIPVGYWANISQYANYGAECALIYLRLEGMFSLS